MKYRIKQVDDVYYIEYTKWYWLYWCEVHEKDLDVMKYYPLQFYSISDALIEVYKRKVAVEKKPIIKYHTV